MLCNEEATIPREYTVLKNISACLINQLQVLGVLFVGNLSSLQLLDLKDLPTNKYGRNMTEFAVLPN